MEFVGRQVRQEVEGFGFFSGVVNSYDPSTGLFEIVYENGDSEELEFSETASLLEGMGDQSGADELMKQQQQPTRVGRKPKKRRRLEIGDSGNNTSAYLTGDGCLKESGDDCGNQEGFFQEGGGLKENVSVNGSLKKSSDDGCNGITRSNNGLNLNDVLDLNVGLNLNDGLDLNEGFNLNVNCEEHLKKKSACIDLNLDANGELEEDLKRCDSGGCIVGTQKKELCFDLNLGLDEEIKNSDGQFVENSSFYVVEDTQKQETGGGRGVEVVQMEGDKKGGEEACCEINGGTQMGDICSYAENEVGDSSVGLVQELQKCGGGGLKAGDTLGAVNANEFSTPEVKLKEGLVGTGTATLLDHGYQGNSGSTNKERNRRKRRKLTDNVNSDTETLLRRSSRRIAAADSSLGLAEEVRKEDIVSGGLKGGEMHGAMGAKDFMHSGVQLEEVLPDAGSSLYHVYEGNSGSTCKEGNRRKRRKLSDNLNSPTETVLRRSSRRLAGTLSAQNHVSSGATLLADNEAQSSAAVSAVLEEKPSVLGCVESEEYSGLPSKLQLPPSSENLNLDGIPVLDLFSVYACLRSFSTLLFLSPFELSDFVAALKSEVPTLLFDCIHVSLLRTLRKHLEFLSNENSLSASNCLRNLNWDLLDLITWPIYLVEYLLMHGSKLKPGFDLCTLKLFESDYYKQPALVKIEILRCLCDDVIEVEAIRSEVNRRTLAAELNMDTDRTMKTETSKRRRTLMDVSGGSCLTEEVVDETTDWNSDECCLCKMDGSLICCDGCPAAYHFRCVGITSSLLPEGDWFCPECVIDKDKPWLKLGKSLRGAELLGVDPYGRLYYSSCGYLLVSDSCDNESLYHYYQRNDLTYVIEAFKSSDTLYNPILGAILRHWNIPINSIGAKCDVDSHNLTVQSVLLKGQMPTTTTVLPLYLAPSETCLRDEIINERKPEENSMAAQYSGNTDCEVSALVNNNPVNLSNVVKMENLLTSSEGSAETSQATGIQKFPKTGLDSFTRSTGILNDSEIQGKILSVGDSSLTSSNLDGEQVKNIQSADCCHMSSMMETRSSGTPQVQLGTGYMNYYSFARTSSLVAEELTRKSSDKITENTIKSVEDIISAQLKAISKKSSKFSWPNIRKLTAGAWKEKCGWCFFCKAPDEDRDCFFNMNDSSLEGFTNDVVGLCSKQTKKGHLDDVICYILCIEDRLHGFLLGPWLNPHFAKIWHKSVVKASDIASLKHLLLLLESNLRPLALSAEWTKHVDSVAAMGSASHIVTSSSRVSSKNGIGRKRARCSDLKPNPSSNAAAGLGLFWWRGGRLSRELFSCKALPRSLASEAARTAGCAKIPGILYPESSDFAKRSKYVAWRAAVETSRTVEQLALQVRELDANIRWDEIENTNLLSKMDQFRKSVRPFKKVIIRRKCIEGTVVKYLLDFGKRRIIPDIVVTHGSVVEESSSGRKKYWLEESHVPLYLLKTFEEKRIARKSSKTSPAKLHEIVRINKKTSKEKGFAYLFAKAERSEYYQCGHCNKDVLIREAVGCQHCKGFFHKRHVRKSAGAIAAECTYTCHKCHSGNFVKLETKKAKSQSQRSKKGSTVSRILRSKITKKVCKDKKPAQKQNSKKDVVALPLRRSARNVKCVVLPTKKVGGRKKRKGKGKGKAKGKGKQIRPGKEMSLKPKNGTWQKKRTLLYHTYWVNGLLLSGKPNDERVMQFRSKKLVTPEQLIVVNDQPKCSLCCEQECTSELNYVSCECCGEWFHGDAFGLTAENVGNLIGFRCHKCRDRTSPVCPHFCRKASDETEMGMNDKAGIECAEEVSSTVVAHSTVVLEEKFQTNEQSRNPTLDDVSGHEDKEPGTPPNLNRVNDEVSNNVVLSTDVIEEHRFHTDETENLLLHDESSHKDQEGGTVSYSNPVNAVIERVEEVCNTIALPTEVPKDHKLFLHTNDLSFDDESNHKDQELGTDPNLNQVIAGMECAEQVSTEVVEERNIHTDEESKSPCLDDESGHKGKEVDAVPNLNQANAENGCIPVGDGQKKEAIQISNDNQRADLPMESNEDVSFAEKTIVVGIGQNGAIVTSVETEFPSSKSDVDVMEMALLHRGE